MAVRHAKKVEFPLPIRIDKLTEVVRINGVPVFVHWSVWVVVVLLFINAVRKPLESIFALAAYFGVLLIHETGHLIAAERLHCEVFSIRLYPIFGITSFETPWSRFDHSLVAWGGVLAQAVIAIPIAIGVSLFGYTRLAAVNAVLAILGFFSIGIALFNLMPFKPLDGSIAWAIIPEIFKRLRNRRERLPSDWR